jgi:hypothetical protein
LQLILDQKLGGLKPRASLANIANLTNAILDHQAMQGLPDEDQLDREGPADDTPVRS